MKRRFKSREEAIEALRKEPAFKDLVEVLKHQKDDQLDRLYDLMEGGRDDAEVIREDGEEIKGKTP
jgi:hypothetical protein